MLKRIMLFLLAACLPLAAPALAEGGERPHADRRLRAGADRDGEKEGSPTVKSDEWGVRHARSSTVTSFTLVPVAPVIISPSTACSA